ATGSKPPSAIPVWRSTTTRSAGAACGGNEMVNDSKTAATTNQKGTILRFCAAVIVLPILWRFDCFEAVKLGYGRDGAVKHGAILKVPKTGRGKTRLGASNRRH